MLFCFNATYQFTPLLNLRPLIFALMPFGWLICIYLKLVLMGYHFWFTTVYLRPHFQEHNLGRKTRVWCNSVSTFHTYHIGKI
jgi:hypothetical protein